MKASKTNPTTTKMNYLLYQRFSDERQKEASIRAKVANKSKKGLIKSL